MLADIFCHPDTGTGDPNTMSVDKNFIRETPEIFFNRELSWLEFNARVLEEAWQEKTPLLDRLKFLSIFTSNQDEFFMVRVAGLKKMLKEGFIHCESPDQEPISSTLKHIHERSKNLTLKQYQYFIDSLLPEMEKENIRILKYDELDDIQKKNMNDYFSEVVFPVLTPLAVDPSHPFPFLTNLSLYLLVRFRPANFLSGQGDLIGFVEIPSVIPRLLPLEDGKDARTFLLLESLVKAHLTKLFLGFDVEDCWMVRVTRNLDYNLLENRVVDLLEAIQKEVVNRSQPEAVRLEVQEDMDPKIVASLKKILHLEKHDLYYHPEPFHIKGFMGLHNLRMPHLKEEEFNPRLPARMGGPHNMFALIREKDLLVHHPYESFYTITEFLNSAATDKDVFAIKQTLYRSSGDSPVIEALIRAAENGKQVTAVVELKARFDEKNNIDWARRLERAGVHVVYGFVGLKTHAKTTLVIRKENDKMLRYVHLSTGNYNSQTARQYTDLGLLTANEAIGQDITALFNLLTGFNILTIKGHVKSGADSIPDFKKVIIAPLELRNFILREIDRVITDHQSHGNGLMIIKLNGIDDKQIIEKLYKASQAGVTIRLIVRGICCLIPGIPKVSENIEVISILDRFLEHSRIYYFRSGDMDRVFLGSADWMSRNMDRRIELMYPIIDPDLKERLILEILNTYLKDNMKARILQSDGSYVLKQPGKGEKKLRAQKRFIKMVREGGIKSIPYEKAMRFDSTRRRGRRPVARRIPVK